jgi:glycerol-3-phosphate dehydrogenase
MTMQATGLPRLAHREELLAGLGEDREWDGVIVGASATGLGVALDAALSGFRVVLVESHDFAAGTSSSATKLVHGGVRSCWVGLRPLVKPPENAAESIKGMRREHTVLVSRSGLATVTRGKWITYRAMADDVIRKCMDESLLFRKSDEKSKNFLRWGPMAKGRAPGRSVTRPGFLPAAPKESTSWNCRGRAGSWEAA